jgi:hypothetical protein
MTTNVDEDSALESLKDDITHLLDQKFDSSNLFELDDMLIGMLVYHDIRELLRKPGLQLVLDKISERATDSEVMVKELSDLNVQVEGMRCVHLVAVHDNPEEMFTSLTSMAFLNEAQTAQLRELVQHYMLSLQVIDDPDDVSTFDMDTSAMLRCLSSEVISAYLDDLYASQRWLQPAKILFDFDKFGSDDTGDSLNAAISLFRFEFLRKENEYLTAIDYLNKLNQPFLADSARLLLFYTHMVRNLSTIYQYIESELEMIEQVLNRLDGYQPGEWYIFEEMQAPFKILLGIMRMTMGGLASLPVEERFKHLEIAERYYAETNLLLYQAQCPSLRWVRAQLLPDFRSNEREKLEAEALKQVYELLTESVLAEKQIDRVTSMTMLMLYPAQWKIAKGDFRGAIENIEIARSFALATTKVVGDEMGSTLEELQKALDDPGTSAEEKEQLRMLLGIYIPISQLADFWKYICELLAQICNAKLAESQQEFQEAYNLYEKAAHLEQDMLKVVLAWMSTFSNFATTMNSPFGSNSSQYGIKATYFQGMALLNRGDHQLMENNYSDASKNYTEAKQAFKTAATLWNAILVDPASQAEARANANREKNLSEDRVFYCDAKYEMAQAQRHSELHEFMKASDRLSNAAEIFAGLYEASFERETERNLKILKASEEFCKGCAFFELARSDKREEIRREARKLVDSAALLFDKAGETRWAKYIRALRFEYEADIYMKLADDSPPPVSISNVQMAQSKIRDAAGMFQQLGMENRARELELSALNMTPAMAESYVMTPFSLPKPAETLPVTQNLVQSVKDQIKFSRVQPDQLDADNLDRLFALASANERILKEIKELLDAGILGSGDYILKLNGSRVKRTEILQEVQKLLEGIDEDFDAILRDAVADANKQELDSDLVDRLVQVASKKGIDASTVDALKKNQQSVIFWLIQIGKELTKVAK